MHRFSVRSGAAEIACVRFGDGGDAARLLYLHALGYSKEHAAGAASVLGAAFDCIALDQRGHGETGAIAGGPLDMALDELVADAGAVLDSAGWDSAIVGGTSMGAAVALRLALLHPERVRVLVQDLPAFGPRTPRDAEHAASIAEALDTGDLPEAARRATQSLSGKRAAALQRELLAQWQPFDRRELGPKLAGAFRATTCWSVLDDWPDGLERVTAPTHVIALRGDPSHPYEVAETMARGIPGAQIYARIPALDPRKSFAQWVSILTRDASTPQRIS